MLDAYTLTCNNKTIASFAKDENEAELIKIFTDS